MDEAVRIVLSTGNWALLQAKGGRERMVMSVFYSRPPSSEERVEFERILTRSLVHLGINPSFFTVESADPTMREQLTKEFLGGHSSSEQIQ